MSGQLTATLTDVLLNVTLALLSLAGAFATLYIRKATMKLQEETKGIQDAQQRNLLDRALWRLDDVALKTVTKIEETIAKDLRIAVKAGTASKEELKKLASDAYDEILYTLEPEYLDMIQESLGDAETYILNTIETKLEEIKRQAQSGVK